MGMPFCHECGAETTPNATFCGGCGIRLMATPLDAGQPDPVSYQMAGDAGAAPASTGSSASMEDTEPPDLDLTMLAQPVSELDEETIGPPRDSPPVAPPVHEEQE